MLVRVYSDIHLDVYEGCEKQWFPPVLNEDKNTTLILAGDLWIGTRWIEFEGKSWISELASRFKNIIVVLGNHDYWPIGELSIKDGAQTCRNMLADRCLFNVHVLDSNSIELEGILFVGSTLWTDMNKSDPTTMLIMSDYMNHDWNILYENQYKGNKNPRFNSATWVQTHKNQLEYIRRTVEENLLKDIFVISHHVPLTIFSEAEDFARAGYYVSDLSDLILNYPNIRYWAFGHSHQCVSEHFNQCLMINRSVGYAFEYKEQNDLIPHDVFVI